MALFVSPTVLAEPTLAPAASGPLSMNPSPTQFDAGPLGNIDITGALTGLAFWQDNPAAGDVYTVADLSNAQFFVQNTEGLVQFFVQAGLYSLPSLGSSYVKAATAASATYGVVPQADLKLVPSENFSLEFGKLPALIGNEYTFTFENMNIERGLLWNQTPSVSRGVQVNYAEGPMAVSVSWNDGYYSNRFNSVTAFASYALENGGGTVNLIGGANVGHTAYSSFATPFAQNNSAIFDAIYTNTIGGWTMTSYLQVSEVPSNRAIGIQKSVSTLGVALLANCKIDEDWNIAARGEYIGTYGALNMLYGSGSNAWSVTVTPTYQRDIFFARAEASYVILGHTQPGLSLGRNLDNTSQMKLMAETGVLF